MIDCGDVATGDANTTLLAPGPNQANARGRGSEITRFAMVHGPRLATVTTYANAAPRPTACTSPRIGSRAALLMVGRPHCGGTVVVVVVVVVGAMAVIAMAPAE